jgi:SAM-dependent methyltransferase
LCASASHVKHRSRPLIRTNRKTRRMAIYLQARGGLVRGTRAVSRASRTSSAAARFAVTLLRSWVARTWGHSSKKIVTALYREMLDREPDLAGFTDHLNLLQKGKLLEVIRGFVGSPEFRARFLRSLVPVSPLPDLKQLLAEYYETQWVAGAPATVYVARTDEDIVLMSSLIERYRYYDRFGVWSPVIDRDKEITAALVRGLGAQSCFELGCFTGAVISLLAEAGLRVVGAEVSHLAFALAYPNVRDNIIFGNLLTLDLRQRFDVVLCMDVLEHVSPLQLDAYIKKLASLVDDDGYLYLNAPMWGQDRIFGVFEEPYLREWLDVGAASYWRHWPCDQSGWPIHGHLVWANADWWERKFRHYGLVRDEVIEQTIQLDLAGFFELAVGRRSLFVLRRPESRCASAAVAAEVHSALSSFL